MADSELVVGDGHGPRWMRKRRKRVLYELRRFAAVSAASGPATGPPPLLRVRLGYVPS